MRWGLSQSDQVVVVANAVKDRTSDFCGFPGERAVVIPNGVELPSVTDCGKSSRQIRTSLRIPPDAVVIGSVGRLAPVKCFDLLLKAFGDLGPSGVEVHLVLVGDGPEAQNLARQAAELPFAHRVHLAGHQPSPVEWLCAMDVYVNSSESEGLSMAVLEAMAVGLPLIVTNVGDHAALVQGDPDCGLVVPRNDLSALANAIHASSNDANMRNRFGGRAKQKYTQLYDVGPMVARYEETYLSLAGWKSLDATQSAIIG